MTYSVKIVTDPKSPNGHWQFPSEPKAKALLRAKEYNERENPPHTVYVFGPKAGEILGLWSNGTYIVGTSATHELYKSLRTGVA